MPVFPGEAVIDGTPMGQETQGVKLEATQLHGQNSPQGLTKFPLFSITCFTSHFANETPSSQLRF